MNFLSYFLMIILHFIFIRICKKVNNEEFSYVFGFTFGCICMFMLAKI